MRSSALALLVLAACKDRSPPAPPIADAAPAAIAAVLIDAGSPAPALPPSDFGPRGPLVVVGYPKSVYAENAVPITDYGITDGGLAYCAHWYGNLNTAISNCWWSDGKTITKKLEAGDIQRKAFVAEHRLHQTIARYKPDDVAPPVTGAWRFARDIKVHVAADEKGGNSEIPGDMRVGGAVGDEKPVWLATTLTERKNPINTSTFIDAVVLSDDGNEFGAVVRTTGQGWDADDMGAYYAKTDHLAAQIYNDTGFRHHKAKEYPRAAELFLLAANADPSWDMPAYNLACAWNRAGDPRASLALDIAIARGGDAVKKRAATDDDLKSLKR